MLGVMTGGRILGQPPTEQANTGILDIKRREWVRNATANTQEFKRKGSDIGELQRLGFKDSTMLLLGPGPSLDMISPYLGHYTKGIPILACNSALNPLAARGIIPELTVCLDAGEEVADQIEEFLGFVPRETTKDACLVCPVTIHPRIPRAWPGRLYWFVPQESTTPQTGEFHKVLSEMFLSLIDDGAPLTLIPNLNCVFRLMVFLAHWLDAKTGLSCGFDLPVDNGMSYSAVRYDLSDKHQGPVPTKQQLKIMDDRMIVLHQQYVAGLLCMLATMKMVFVNLSPLASFKQYVPYLPPSSLATGIPQPEAKNGND